MATIPTPASYTVREALTAAIMNAGVHDPLAFLLGGAAGRKPRLTASTSGQSVPNSAATTLQFPSATIDDDGGLNTTTGVYTVATPGLWQFVGTIQWTSNTTGQRALSLTSTGSPGSAWAWTPAASDSLGRTHVTLLTYVATSATITLAGYQTSGGALTTSTTSFAGMWLSA